MAQFSVQYAALRTRTRTKFRVKWTAAVAGISKVGALKRSTELVEHRARGDSEHLRASRPGAPKFEVHHARARRHP